MSRDRYSDDHTIQILYDYKTLYVLDNINVAHTINAETLNVDVVNATTINADIGGGSSINGDLEITGDLSVNHIHNRGSSNLKIESHNLFKRNQIF